MNLKRVMTWLAVALVLLYVIQSPDHAAEVARDAGAGLVDVASSLVSFVGSLS